MLLSTALQQLSYQTRRFPCGWAAATALMKFGTGDVCIERSQLVEANQSHFLVLALRACSANADRTLLSVAGVDFIPHLRVSDNGEKAGAADDISKESGQNEAANRSSYIRLSGEHQ
jgi:hypothetical protein